MKAMLLEKQSLIETAPLKLVDLPLPEPKEHEVQIKVHVCGVCRTDLHVIEGDLKHPNLPLIPGHQVVGVVTQLGKGAKRFKIGDRIGVAWLRGTCGQCEFCKEHKENLCKQSIYTGYEANGGYAEYAVVPEDYAYLIPSRFSDEEAAPLLCAGIVGYRAYKRACLPKGGKLGIIGFGSSAHIICQIAEAQGSQVYVSTRHPRHQAFAKKMGAVWASGDLQFPVLLDSIIVFAPAGELVPKALESLKPGGTVSIAGIHLSDIPAINYETHLFHEKNVRSVESNTREDGEEFLKLAEAIPIKPVITVFPLEQANEVLLQVKQDALEGTAVLKVSNFL